MKVKKQLGGSCMNNKQKSLELSIWIVRIFAVLLLIVTFGVYPFLKWYMDVFNWDKTNETLIMLTIGMYISIPFAWITLYCLHKLLTNIKKKVIFDNENVKMLNVISWSCFAVAFVGLIIILIYLPKFALSFAIVTVAAFFVGLLVRVVKNVFENAIMIKEENDLTI